MSFTIEKFGYIWSDDEIDNEDEIYEGVYGEQEIQENLRILLLDKEEYLTTQVPREILNSQGFQSTKDNQGEIEEVTLQEDTQKEIEPSEETTAKCNN
ncbi:hypothetical protein PVK06_047776 [Gossypium arboreum]|uniref:Uncharacterized protein n=1 Tax=Gossypium arboreum TaxID=29729 RepID=A0ABR0MGS7_GOSAR|nr:hypothetical protein PVK06_047776 [Gossypium arboreum]